MPTACAQEVTLVEDDGAKTRAYADSIQQFDFITARRVTDCLVAHYRLIKHALR